MMRNTAPLRDEEMIAIEKTLNYERWFLKQRPKFQVQIEKRLENIKSFDHFGHVKDLSDGLFEIKFNNGSRIYFARTEKSGITLLSGGNKNGQDKDIRKARSLFSR
jgi:putative addiction module killer protein